MVLWDAVNEYLNWLKSSTLLPIRHARVNARLAPLVARLGPERELATLRGPEIRDAILTAGTDTIPLRRVRAHWWRCFWQWATSRGMVALPVETFMPYPWPDLEYTQGIPFSDDERRAMAAYRPSSYQDYLAIAAASLVASGVRPSLLPRLTLDDMRLEWNALSHDSQSWKLDDSTCGRLLDWIKVRNQMGHERALFTHQSGKQYKVGYDDAVESLSAQLGFRLTLERCWQHWRSLTAGPLCRRSTIRCRRRGRRLNNASVPSGNINVAQGHP